MSHSTRQHNSASTSSQSSVTGSTVALPPIIGNVTTPSAAAAAIAKSKQDYVQVDALVLMKILKHCHEMGGGAELPHGILTGMIQTQDSANGPKRIEITNSFGLPNPSTLKASNVDYYDVCNTHSDENIESFRRFNIDNLKVGWYQSSLFGSFINKSLIEDHFVYQADIEDPIILIYDPFKTQHGSLSFKAYRLNPSMMELEKRREYSSEAIKELKLNYENFMEELPVVIKNSHMVNSLLCELEEMSPSPKRYSFLDLSTSNVMEKNLRSLIENVDELASETNKFLNYHKQLQRQNHLKQQYLQKREAENSARKARGEPPLPEEDINKIYKPIPPISRLETLFISNQIKHYCNQINDFTSQSFSNLFITEALQNK